MNEYNFELETSKGQRRVISPEITPNDAISKKSHFEVVISGKDYDFIKEQEKKALCQPIKFTVTHQEEKILESNMLPVFGNYDGDKRQVVFKSIDFQ